MTIWIDDEYKCHASAADGLRETESSFFDGKCVEFVEGYRFVPFGEIWTRDDGELFKGEMVTPWKPWEELEEAQKKYELMGGHAGTINDPIPFEMDMEIYNGMHYIQNDILYLCTKDSGQPLHHDLSLLVDVYVVVVNE